MRAEGRSLLAAPEGDGERMAHPPAGNSSEAPRPQVGPVTSAEEKSPGPWVGRPSRMRFQGRLNTAGVHSLDGFCSDGRILIRRATTHANGHDENSVVPDRNTAAECHVTAAFGRQ